MQELLDDELSGDKFLDNKREKRLSKLIIVQAFIALGATLLAGFYDIVSIIITGPIGSIYGMIVFFAALSIPSKKGMWIGLSAPIISLCCFLVIYTLHWSESTAHIPITMALAIYTTILMVYIKVDDFF